MIYANTLRPLLPQAWVPGVKFCSKQILRLGVILYGFRLTIQQVLEIGLPAIAVDIIIVCGTLGIGILAEGKKKPRGKSQCLGSPSSFCW